MRLLKLFPDNTNIRFLRWQWPTTVVSALLMIASCVLLFTQGLNLGVDFVGGQMIRVTFTQSQVAPVATLRGEIEKLGYGEPIIQTFGSPNAISIRMRLPAGSDKNAGLAETMTKRITGAIKAAHADARVDGVDSVSGKVSQELGWTAFQALGFAAIAISIYIWFRFEWQFGVGAMISTTHDVITTVGLFAIFQLDFNLTTLAAILTIAGYSINDTVVIYDRVRESMRKYRTMPFRDLINLALNETLSRTILTVATTALAVLALLFLGGEVLRGFSIAMLWGIVIGTYSSLFIAAPLLYYVQPNRRAIARTAETEEAGAERASR
jgi:preprotein translocase subunit SecF